MKQTYTPTNEDTTWARTMTSMLAEGGSFICPNTGAHYIVSHKAKTFSLQNADPVYAEMVEVFKAIGYTVKPRGEFVPNTKGHDEHCACGTDRAEALADMIKSGSFELIQKLARQLKRGEVTPFGVVMGVGEYSTEDAAEFLDTLIDAARAIAPAEVAAIEKIITEREAADAARRVAYLN